ncbi:WRB/Get1 family [Absidia repens]|uniref:WRB/Get1 family n=1 Tax=Absidia repens TaxID=90262 RepID=A0A1X2IXB6_9FUNG|nr:WRB/Get1 family [Absidia repens]
MYLPTFIFLLVLLTETILFLGYSYVTSAAHDLYLKASKDPRATKQDKLKRDLLKMKNDLAATSSQDEFAKWAKMRRRLDKGITDLEKLNSDIAFSKTGFELKLKSILWFLIHGSQVLMVLWFRKSPVFYLPPGWFGPAQRLLCMPFSPLGSVSVAVWFAACRRMIKAIALTVNDFIITKNMGAIGSATPTPSTSTS